MRQITLTVYTSVPIPTNGTIPHLSPNHHQIILSIMTFPSPVSSPSSKGPISAHLPTPSCSILLDNFPNPRPTLDMLSDAGPVDQYDASLWQPDCTVSIPVHARDGEFECFILDEQGCLRNPDPTSCLALTVFHAAPKVWCGCHPRCRLRCCSGVVTCCPGLVRATSDVILVVITCAPKRLLASSRCRSRCCHMSGLDILQVSSSQVLSQVLFRYCSGPVQCDSVLCSLHTSD